MLHRAGLCGVLLCWVVFALSVSGLKKGNGYEELYDCLHNHICVCSYNSTYQKCFNKLPGAAIDGFEKLAHQKFAEISNVKQSLDTVWSVLCKEPKEVFFPFFIEAYDDLIAYEKNLSRHAGFSQEQSAVLNARICVMPLVARCLETRLSRYCF